MNNPGQEEDEEDEEDSNCKTEDDNAGQDVVPKIKSYKETIVALEDVVLDILKHKGNTEEATYEPWHNN